MAKAPTLPTITGSYASSTQLNAAFRAIEDSFENTLSLDGSTPNSMAADIDLNSNDLLNVGTLDADVLRLNGSLVTAAELVEVLDETLPIESFGFRTSNTGAVNSAAAVEAFAWLNGGTYRRLTIGAGTYNIASALPTITQSNVAVQGTSREATRLLLPSTSTNSKFIQVGTGASTVSRVLISGLRLEHDNTSGSLSGYAIVLDGANDTVIEDINVQDVAGVLDVGPTLKCSRLRIHDFRGNYQDTLNHRIGRFQRWTGMLVNDFVVYGGGTFYRTVPTFDFSSIGICDTLNWNKVTCWTRSGSKYGVFVNADNGTFVNAWFNEVVFDKTGKDGGAFWFEMTPASTASSDNFWKIQNVYINGRSDQGGVEGDDGDGSIPVGGRGGRSLVVNQGASTTYSAIRGITATLLSSVRDGAVIRTTHTGTDEAENINLVNCDFRDASVEGDAVESVVEMGINDFSISHCNFVFAERPPVSLNIDYAIKITNAAIDTFTIVGNKVLSVTNGLILHPTYTTLSPNRIEVGNSVVAGGTADLALPMLSAKPIRPTLSTSTTNASANVTAINDALALSVTLGGRQVLVDTPGVYPVNARITLPTGSTFNWVNAPGVVYQPIYDNASGFVAASNQALEVTDSYIENLTIRPAVDAGTGNPYIGNALVARLRRTTINGLRAEGYWGDQGFLLMPYQSVVKGLYAYTTSTAGGTGACRILGGEDSQIYTDMVYCGDDGLQFVPALSGTHANLSIKNVQYIGGISSSNARPFIAFVDTGLTANITNCGFVGITGISRQATLATAGSVVVTSQGPGGVVGLQITGCSIDETARTTFSAGAHGLRIEGNVSESTIDLTILEPQQQLVRMLPNAGTGLFPQRNHIKITSNKAPRDGNTSVITITGGSRNTIQPFIYSCSNNHVVLVNGGDRTSIRDGHILSIPTSFAGVRDATGANTDVSRIQFQGTGNSYSFAATPAVTGRVFDCDLGGLTASGTAPTLSNNRA